MKLDMRYGHHPEDVKHYDTETGPEHEKWFTIIGL